MAGGTFTAQNKVRPGAYIKFKGVPATNNIIGSRGIVSFAAPIGWGPEDELIKITVDDLMNGNLTKLIGVDYFSSEAKLVRAALQNAHTLLLYRGDKGGEKATIDIELAETAGTAKLTATAKYAGVVGNAISIYVKLVQGAYYVSTYLGSVQKDVQVVADIKDLVSNDFVDFSGTGVIAKEAVNTLLVGGENGTFSNTEYNLYLAKLRNTTFDTLAAYKFGSESLFNGEDIKAFIQDMREIRGIKCQAVINNFVAANYEGVISTYGQGVKFTDDTELSGDEFVIWVAGATAGADVIESNTYKVIPDAVSILNDVIEDDIESLILTGYLLISQRRDGAIVIEKDINTLVTLGSEVTEAFKENNVIRLLDGIANHIALDFEQNYIGKVNNDATGRGLFKSSIVSYLNNLQQSGAIINFDSAKDVSVTAGEQKEAFYSELNIQPSYSVDKLYMVVNVN